MLDLNFSSKQLEQMISDFKIFLKSKPLIINKNKITAQHWGNIM